MSRNSCKTVENFWLYKYRASPKSSNHFVIRRLAKIDLQKKKKVPKLLDDYLNLDEDQTGMMKAHFTFLPLCIFKNTKLRMVKDRSVTSVMIILFKLSKMFVPLRMLWDIVETPSQILFPFVAAQTERAATQQAVQDRSSDIEVTVYVNCTVK